MMEQAALRLTDKVFSLFEPDALLPVQYFETLRRKIPLEPEKRLMWAILEDAVDRYQKHLADPRDKSGEEFAEVESWITERDSSWFCSFDNICETLGIDPQYLRLGLLAWKEKRLASSRCVEGKSGNERLTASG